MMLSEGPDCTSLASLIQLPLAQSVTVHVDMLDVCGLLRHMDAWRKQSIRNNHRHASSCHMLFGFRSTSFHMCSGEFEALVNQTNSRKGLGVEPLLATYAQNRGNGSICSAKAVKLSNEHIGLHFTTLCVLVDSGWGREWRAGNAAGRRRAACKSCPVKPRGVW